MASKTTNYELWMPDSTDNFDDFLEEFNENMETIDNNLGGGGGGSGGHTILDGDGNALPQEDDLQFTGACSVTDDNVNGRTVVDIKGGYIFDAQRYSDNEKVVGVWRDNKPLYQKTINFGALPNTATKRVNHNIANIDKIWVYDGYALNPISGYVNQLNLSGTDNLARQWYCGCNDTFVEVVTNNDRTAYSECYITVRYTKTTDTAGSGGYEAYGFSPVIYSDTERKIGVWRDNKPLYQKTFIATLNNIANDTATNIADISGLNIDEVADISGRCNYYNGANWFNVDFSTYYAVYAYPNGYLQFKQKMTNVTVDRVYKVAITLRYTKTTDVAGSGDYNTYGVPTHHYSTNEQVIGTYFGKPLYEKTWDNVSIGISGTNWVYFNDPVDIDNVISFDAYWNNSDRYLRCAISEYQRSNSNGIMFAGFNGMNRTVNRITAQYTKITD